MKKLTLYFMAIAIFSACSFDPIMKHRFAGKYEARLSAPKSDRDIRKAKRELERNIRDTKKDIDKGIEDAKKDIERELENENNIKDALKDLMAGVGKMAEGLTDLGEGLGKIGLDLGQDILRGIKFKVEFKKNGEVVFGNGSRDIKHWNIEKGTLYIWDYEDEKMAFEMKQVAAREWELIGKNITFHLTEIK